VVPSTPVRSLERSLRSLLVHVHATLLPAPCPSLDVESVVYKLAAAGAGVVITVLVALERCLLVSRVLVPQRKIERIAVSGGACSTR
jgi:hypothetical protein